MTNGGANKSRSRQRERPRSRSALASGSSRPVSAARRLSPVGVTLRQSSTQAQLYLRAQFSQVWATKVGTDEWVLGGDFGGLLNYVAGGFRQQ
jgi:hypothetical protein